MKLTWETSSAEETSRLGEVLATRLEPDGIALLRGPLGAGKTVLAQGIARGMGLDESQVQSPSFTLVREHDADGRKLIHIDLYRLDPVDVEGIGIWEILSSPGVKVVEWPERLPPGVESCLDVEIRTGSKENERVLTVIDHSRSTYSNDGESGSTELDLKGAGR